MSLSSESVAAFEGALRELAVRLKEMPAQAGSDIHGAFAELTASDLPETEQARRARRITEEVRVDPALTAILIEVTKTAAPEIRAGVQSALSPELLALLFAVSSAEAVPDTSPAEVSNSGDDEAQQESSGDRDLQASGEWRTVLVLGDPQEVEANERFLNEHDYRSIRVSSERDLVALTDESYCAVVVHTGFWGSLEEGRTIRAVLRDQFARASIPVYKIDSSGFADEADEIVSLRSELSAEVQSRVTLATGAALNDTDLAQIGPYAGLLESAVTASLTIEGLSERETRLLTTAASLFAAELRGGPVPVRARDVTVAPLTDGRSGARVYRVVVRAAGIALVAKFDDVSRLKDEFATARMVMPVGQPIDIEIYALGGCAVLLQRLVADNDEPMRAAPSFKERIEARGAWERGRRSEPEPSKADLLHGVGRLLRSLKQIATAPAGDAESRCWLGTEPLDELAAQGVVFEIESSAGPFDPRAVLPDVLALLEPASKGRLVHGDLHAGNVLMADDRTPLLIDFANAGAGHPCFDVVRFASAVAFYALRPVRSEARMRELFTRIHVDGAAPDELATEFSDVLASDSALLAVECLCAARVTALELVPDDAEKQYLAMTFLIAAQSLTMYDFQGAIVRPALGAIYPSVTAQPA